MLVSQFTMVEIRQAIKDLGMNKAPGLDGYTVEFLLKFWDHFKEDFMKLSPEFYENGKLNACIKENFICLIPKKEDAVSVKDFSPLA